MDAVYPPSGDGARGVAVIIPARDEEEAIVGVLRALSGRRVVVVDNGSRDRTAEVARAGGAEVVSEPTAGYGRACLAGIRALKADPPGVLVIMDGDGSDDAALLPALVAPIEGGDADLVIGRRTNPRALTAPQRVGNRVATTGMRLLTGHRYADLGPLRALRWEALERLEMQDQTWGWNVEMQMKAARLGLRVLEIPVHNRPRAAGESKISGNLKGSVKAGRAMLEALWRYR